MLVVDWKDKTPRNEWFIIMIENVMLDNVAKKIDIAYSYPLLGCILVFSLFISVGEKIKSKSYRDKLTF